MSNLKDLYSQSGDESQTSNFGVDFVIHYKVPPLERAEAEAGFVQLIQALTTVGLATEVRHGDNNSLLIFVKVASPDLFAKQVYRARLADWLHGVRVSAPHSDVKQALHDEPVVEAERLRLIYLMITKPRNEGGAGITPSNAKWKYVESIFPLHSHKFNKDWIKKWSSKYILEQSDIDDIRDKFGESVAFYFAFLRSYFRFLVIPSGFGFVAWLLLGQFSFLYTLLCGLWSVVFLEYWKKQEVDLAVQWGVRGVSNIQQARPEFEWDREAEDPVTGEVVKVYEPMKRIKTQLLQIPFALACVLALGALIVTCNSLEVFINEVYNGPGKQYLGFLPTILLVLGTPTISSLLMSAAEKLNSMENYATVDAHDAALIQKQFVLNFMTSYMALFFTAFVYIPFGHVLVPFLEFWRRSAQVVTFSEKPLPTREFQINPARISNQMFYFTVTAQIVNFATEVVVPYLKREALEKAKALKSQPKVQDDHEEEAEFLERVRKESALEAYDVSGDYREMVMQFGYVSMFSVAWPLAACCFLVNNWVELRSDALKIATSSRRPIPWRTDSIGPWLTALSFISWLGSITSSAIVYLCSGARGNGNHGEPSPLKAWGLLLSILLAEHFYLVVQLAVRFVLSKLDSPGVQKERKERFLMKRKLLEENIGQGASEESSVPGIDHSEKITREALEEEARQTSIRGHGTPEETFWQRQRGMNETIDVGRRMIEQQEAAAEKNGKAKSAVPSMKAA
ncbi:IST2 [Fusarium subglutinans]|uniref:IST2 n=1 Tax=Gibberella subglutinans TaxID=42677 RepID=A0A8H5V205_GIBSU|nr:IST2 [Fusarium subglutinans]KAF5607606.1 IST2 [Fusarium subglutinans]